MSKRTHEGDDNDEHAHTSKQPRVFDSVDPSPREPAKLELSYTRESSQPTKSVPFQQPTQLTSFSYSEEHILEFTNSALRYFVDPPIGAKLGYGYDRWIRRPEERGRLDGLLKVWSKFQSDNPGALGEIGVVAWRGVMTKLRILTAPYEERDGWDLNVMLINGTMYFEEHLSEEKIKSKNDVEPRHRMQMYYGYAFESYCTSDSSPTRPAQRTPSIANMEHPPGWSGDVNTNVQWCSVVKTKLGDARMVIGGEVDCVRGRYTSQTDNFVELKTSMTIRGANDAAKFERKLLKFYFQSFLLGVPEIVVGFRTPAGILTTVQTFRTIEIPRMIRGKPGAWDPASCLEWGDRFLRTLRSFISSARDPPPGASQSSFPASTPATQVWRVCFKPKSGVTVQLLDEAAVMDVEAGDEERVGFLPKWYYDQCTGD
ncbi:hypothetical protein ONZ45_g789 [Pleurotus djamor]|nr:hypothetical protein ONZ45_g789 [Pleurotus djamor]